MSLYLIFELLFLLVSVIEFLILAEVVASIHAHAHHDIVSSLRINLYGLGSTVSKYGRLPASKSGGGGIHRPGVHALLRLDERIVAREVVRLNEVRRAARLPQAQGQRLTQRIDVRRALFRGGGGALSC